MGRPTWLSRYWPDVEPQEYKVEAVYVTSLYWAIVTCVSVGYGDIIPYPTSIPEQAIAILAVVFVSSRWAIVIGSVVELVRDMEKGNEEYKKTMDTCERIVRLQGIEGKLCYRIREYFTKFYELQAEKGTRALVKQM